MYNTVSPSMIFMNAQNVHSKIVVVCYNLYSCDFIEQEVGHAESTGDVN